MPLKRVKVKQVLPKAKIKHSKSFKHVSLRNKLNPFPLKSQPLESCNLKT